MKARKKKFLISILSVSTVAVGSSAAIGITSTNQKQDIKTSDSISTYTSVPMPGPTLDDPRIPSTGGGNNGSGITTSYEIDWSNKTSPTENVYFDGDLAYTNKQRAVLLGMNPNTQSTKVSLPSSVKEIKGYTKVSSIKSNNKQVVGAFEGIENITNVSISGSDVKIDANAFKGCKKLEAVIMNNNGIRTIGKSAFEGCSSLKAIKLSSSLTTLESNAFKDTSSLTQITLPNNLRSIGESAFENSGLTSVNMQATKVSTIGNNAFKNANKLVNLRFSNSLNSIGNSAFENTSIIKIFITSSSLPTIGNSAFKNCSELLEFKSSSRSTKLTSIPESIFENCIKLSNVEFLQSTARYTFSKIGKNAFKGTKITTFNISNIRSIGESAFENCSSLTTLTGQNVLEFIENNAFKNSRLQVINSVRSMQNDRGVTYLSNVVKIGTGAFYGTKLTTFKSGAYLTTIGDESFKSISTLVNVDFTLSSRLMKNKNAFDPLDLSKVNWPTNRVFRGNRITH